MDTRISRMFLRLRNTYMRSSNISMPAMLIAMMLSLLMRRAFSAAMTGPPMICMSRFLCLVPLNAPALHDLGLFASLLLAGTILFVLIFLPHAVKTRKTTDRTTADPRLITRLAGLSLENNRRIVWGVLVLTLVFGFFSLRTEFDSDMRNINYMTDEQKADLEYFSSLANQNGDTEKTAIPRITEAIPITIIDTES